MIKTKKQLYNECLMEIDEVNKKLRVKEQQIADINNEMRILKEWKVELEETAEMYKPVSVVKINVPNITIPKTPLTHLIASDLTTSKL